MTETNRNVASKEYETYCTVMDNELREILNPWFPKDLIDHITGYALLDECEHFEAIISLNPSMFEFVWVFNTMHARRNWAHDLHSRAKFVAPEHITCGSVLTFNGGPSRMLELAYIHTDNDVPPIGSMEEDMLVDAYHQSAARFRMNMRPCGMKYAGIVTQEYEKYLLWMNTTIVGEIDLPRDLAACVIGYVTLEVFEYFTAVIQVDPTEFSVVYDWNDIFWKPQWYQSRLSENPYKRLARIMPDTIATFNENIRMMINVTRVLGMFGKTDNSGQKAICKQFRANASLLTSKSYPIAE